MAVKIKLLRMGKIRAPHYRIVVADARTKRDGRAIEAIGHYNPLPDPSLISLNSERVQYWLGVGAQPTEPVRAILEVTGDWQRFTGQAGAEGSLRTGAAKPDKKAVFEAAAREAAGVEGGRSGRGQRAGAPPGAPVEPPAAASPAAAPEPAATPPTDSPPEA